MSRANWRSLWLVAGVLCVLLPVRAVLAQSPAMEFMQEEFKRKDRERRPALVPAPRDAARHKKLTPAELAARQVNSVPDTSAAVTEQLKSLDARRVLVIGDSGARGLAVGLQEVLAEDPMLQVVDAGGIDGNLAASPTDWPAALTPLLDVHKPVMVVVMLGGNDRAAIRDGALNHDWQSARWRELYAQRVEALVRYLNGRKLVVYWVGRAPMRGKIATAEAVYLNEIYRERTFAAGARFIDPWEGFVDLEGRYVAVGPDVNGAVRRLRRPDGESFSPAGNRKLAFYVEREMRKDFPSGSMIDAVAPQPASAPSGPVSIKLVPDNTPQGRYIGPVLPLNGYRNEAAELAGEAGARAEPHVARSGSVAPVVVQGQ